MISARWTTQELVFMCWTRETGVIAGGWRAILLGMNALSAPMIESVTFIVILIPDPGADDGMVCTQVSTALRADIAAVAQVECVVTTGRSVRVSILTRTKRVGDVSGARGRRFRILTVFNRISTDREAYRRRKNLAIFLFAPKLSYAGAA